MDAFRFPVQLRWADMDPNFHLRHDAYYGLGAQARVEALLASGITPQVMQQNDFGPILFREECVFRREMRLGDQVDILVRVSKARMDGSRWSFKQEFVRSDGTLCAVLNVDGAWIDTKLRKLAVPPQEFMGGFLRLPRTEDFEELAPAAVKPG
jgi:acyl-CoA thioester hydrolase